MGQEFGSSLDGWFWLGISHEVNAQDVSQGCSQLKTWCQVLLGDGGSSSKRIALDKRSQFLSWQEASIHCHVNLSIEQFEYPTAWQLVSPIAIDPRERGRKLRCLLWPVTAAIFCLLEVSHRVLLTLKVRTKFYLLKGGTSKNLWM